MRLRVGLLGTPPPEWASLCRTYDCYRRALDRDFDLRLPGTAEEAARLSLDAVIGFWGAQVWTMGPAPGPPRMVCLHGGAVVNYPHLPALLSTLTDHDAILCNCTSDEAIVDVLLPRAPRPRTVVLPLPVAATLGPRSRAAARARLGLPPDASVLGFVSRLVPQKGLHYFLRTLAACRARLPAPVHGLVVGDFWTGYGLLDYFGDRYRDYVAGLLVRDGLVDAVTFRPPGGDDLLADYYAAMDLLVHPTTSVDENFGYVPLEALACGRPVLTCAYGGLKDTVAGVHELASVPTWSTSTGIRFDDAALRRQAVRLLRDSGVRDDVVASGRAVLAERHTFAAFADRLAGAVHDLARRHRAGGPPVAAHVPPTRAEPQVSHLPRTDPDWGRLRPAVDRYVSCSPSATAAPGTTFRPWPDLEQRRDGVCVIHDPAWPGTVPVTAGERRALRDPGSAPAPTLRSLVESGLLAWSGSSG
jgi:glycosyltransferase involved in cell wall biosynthesis